MLTRLGMIAMGAVFMVMLIKHPIGSKNSLVFRMLLYIFGQTATANVFI
jgi:hypothetical protein